MSLSQWGYGRVSTGSIVAFIDTLTVSGTINAQTASFTSASFTSITTAALTVSRPAPSVLINDTSSLQTLVLGVSSANGGYFTNAIAGDVIVRGSGSNLLLGVGLAAAVSISSTDMRLNGIFKILRSGQPPVQYDMGIANTANDLTPGSVQGDSCLIASQRLLVGTPILQCTGSIGATISMGTDILDVNTINCTTAITTLGLLDIVNTQPKLRIFQPGAASEIGMALNPNDFITGSALNDLCIATTVGSIRIKVNDPSKFINLHSQTKHLGAYTLGVPNGTLITGVANTIGQYFFNQPIGSSAIRSTGRLFIGTDGEASEVQVYGSNFTFNNERVTISGGAAQLRFDDGQTIDPGFPEELVLTYDDGQYQGSTLNNELNTGYIINNKNRAVVINASYSILRNTGGAGATWAWINPAAATDIKYGFVGTTGVADLYPMTGSASFILQPNSDFQVRTLPSAISNYNSASVVPESRFFLTYTWQYL